jgi:hypothetical protein
LKTENNAGIPGRGFHGKFDDGSDNFKEEEYKLDV